MATWKSQPRNMVFEGKVQVLDKFIVYHRNVDASHTARVMAYGVAGTLQERKPTSTARVQAYSPLIYELSGEAKTVEPGNTDITVASEGNWWYCAGAGTITADTNPDETRTYVIGDLVYLEVDGVVSGANAQFYKVIGIELNKGGTTQTGTVLQAAYSPCQSIMYEVSDVENLKNLYSALMTFKVSTDLDDSGS